jgi:acetyl esterase/lipase
MPRLQAAILAAVLLASGCAVQTPVPTPSPSPTPTAPARAVVVNDVVYATPLDPKASEWMLDIYAPVAEAAGPVVVFGHAHHGSRAGYVELGEALAERGAVVFIVDWLDDPDDVALQDDGRGVREMTECFLCAVRYATARAPDHGGDPQRMVVGGHSYAGPVSAWVALEGEGTEQLWEEFAASRGGPPPQLQCTEEGTAAPAQAHISVGGAYNYWDVDRLWENDPELMELADIYPHVGQNQAMRVALILGESDTTIGVQVEAFEKALADAGYDVELITWDGKHSVPIDLTVETTFGLVE